jgi:hypothetical protein
MIIFGSCCCLCIRRRLQVNWHWGLELDDWTVDAVQLSPASIIIQWRELITSRALLAIIDSTTAAAAAVFAREAADLFTFDDDPSSGCTIQRAKLQPLNHTHSHVIELTCQNVRMFAGLRSDVKDQPKLEIIAWIIISSLAVRHFNVWLRKNRSLVGRGI